MPKRRPCVAYCNNIPSPCRAQRFGCKQLATEGHESAVLLLRDADLATPGYRAAEVGVLRFQERGLSSGLLFPLALRLPPARGFSYSSEPSSGCARQRGAP